MEDRLMVMTTDQLLWRQKTYFRGVRVNGVWALEFGVNDLVTFLQSRKSSFRTKKSSKNAPELFN